jgi:hypothetical protein
MGQSSFGTRRGRRKAKTGVQGAIPGKHVGSLMLQCSSQTLFVQCNMAKLALNLRKKYAFFPGRDKSARSTPVYSNFRFGLSW